MTYKVDPRTRRVKYSAADPKHRHSNKAETADKSDKYADLKFGLYKEISRFIKGYMSNLVIKVLTLILLEIFISLKLLKWLVLNVQLMRFL